MRLELWIVGVTLFFMVDMYYESKYTKWIWSFKKYYQIGLVGVVGLGLVFLMQRNPSRTQNLLMQANSIIKHMPIAKESQDMLDLTLGGANFINQYQNNMANENELHQPQQNPNPNQTQTQTQKPTKRVVSETKKKYVASQQGWKCGICQEQLNHTFEVDHKRRLEYGGTNDPTNLVALCRNCHGHKTAMENMK